MRAIQKRLTYANLIATLALFLALGGAAYAATQLPRNSVGTAQLKKGAVTAVKIARQTRQQLIGSRGPTGPQGPTGAPGQTGAQGERPGRPAPKAKRLTGPRSKSSPPARRSPARSSRRPFPPGPTSSAPTSR